MLSVNQVEDAASFEDKHIALQAWWERHNKNFNLWYCSLSTEKQKQLILKASPDMPEKAVTCEEMQLKSPENMKQATDIILPELNYSALLSNEGRVLVLFLTRRLVSTDRCFISDIILLHNRLKHGLLPVFSGGNLNGIDTPFVDPFDPEENVRSLSPETPAEGRAEILAHFETGRLVHADVWIALKIRRAAIVAFIETLVIAHQEAATEKPSPTYLALLRAEIEQQQAFGGESALQLMKSSLLVKDESSNEKHFNKHEENKKDDCRADPTSQKLKEEDYVRKDTNDVLNYEDIEEVD